MSTLFSWRFWEKPIVLFSLIMFFALTGWSQNAPMLKTTVIPHSDEPTLRNGGLLTTTWTQEAPFNMLCPIDPLENNAHCYTGCPATAMGQILNYLQTTNNTRFNDGDDYNHSYAGRNYRIDDDWQTMQFPSFPQLNDMLDAADAAFQRRAELSDSLIAALIFACGTACTQIYTASPNYGSGTFYVDQAYAAYQRFGFAECQLYREASDEMYATLISNLQAGYPAHLAVENNAGNSGHNVVVDGYRESDGKFHINFGWGGYKDNWYNLPDPNGFGYGWTKIEGIIVNIIPTTTPSTLIEASSQPLEVFPNPVSDVLYLKNLSGEQVNYSIFNVLGQEVMNGSSCGTISVADLEKGVYFLQVEGENSRETVKFVVE